MHRIVAIGGEPATGKTTLMRKLLEDLKLSMEVKQSGLLRYHEGVVEGQVVYVLGIYSDPDKIFAGGDLLSMAVQPAAKDFLGFLEGDSVIIFEGDRLFNQSFLEFCDDLGELCVILLKVPGDVVTARRMIRSPDQDEKFCASRRTKVSGVFANPALQKRCKWIENETIEQQNRLGEILVKLASKPLNPEWKAPKWSSEPVGLFE